jgi:hypothetical protein
LLCVCNCKGEEGREKQERENKGQEKQPGKTTAASPIVLLFSSPVLAFPVTLLLSFLLLPFLPVPFFAGQGFPFLLHLRRFPWLFTVFRSEPAHNKAIC